MTTTTTNTNANNNKNKNQVVVIGGNIGCGKSTLLRRIHDATTWLCYPEPVKEWSDWLSRFAERPDQYNAIGLQTRVLLSFLEDQSNTRLSRLPLVKVYERSVLDCVEVFGRVLQSKELLTSGQMNALRELAEGAATVGSRPDLYVYLRSNPLGCCLERVEQRARKSDAKTVDAQYLQHVHDAYEHFVYYTLPVLSPKTKVVFVDVNFKKPEEVADVVLEQIRAHVVVDEKVSDDYD